jgi:ABC-type glycerol-3-phosphate transport system substrate-binding protein
MPMTRDSRALYWNRRRFREAGLDPDRPPQTMEEALTMAKRMTRRNPDGSLAQLGMSLPDDAALLFAAFGGGVWDERTGRVTANRPENVAALRWQVALADAQGGVVAVNAYAAGFGKDASGQNPLATGKVAMQINGEWIAMYLEKYAPGTDYRIGEIPYPASRPDLRNMAWQDGDILVIPNGARRPGLAWEFIRWMQQLPQQDYYAGVLNNLPTRLALRASPHLTRGSRSRRALGYVLDHIASNAGNAHFFPPLPVTQLYGNALQDAFDRALFHEKTPEQALADVQVRIEREMQRYADSGPAK